MMDERDDEQSAAVLNESQVGFHVPPVEASGTVSQEGQSCPSTSSGGQDCPPCTVKPAFVVRLRKL